MKKINSIIQLFNIKILYRFILVGLIGFIIDASFFMILINSFNAAKDLYISSLFKAITFILAVYITYLGNYFFTFKNNIIRRNSKSLFFKYLSGQLLGWITNFISFILSNNFTEVLIQRLVIASFFGMFINFLLSNIILIKPK